MESGKVSYPPASKGFVCLPTINMASVVLEGSGVLCVLLSAHMTHDLQRAAVSHMLDEIRCIIELKGIDWFWLWVNVDDQRARMVRMTHGDAR